MCCLFGLYNYKATLSRKEKNQIITALSMAAEDRGTDATGIAYNTPEKLAIFKRPLPAHLMWFRVPQTAKVVMGHTRMTTQGNEVYNQNNHPFFGTAGQTEFALAHNGVLWNDKILRKSWELPETNVETDSYIAVQLLELAGDISFDSLRQTAEELEGSFTISVLTDKYQLYFIQGDNPLCIYHYEKLGVYLYASTENILKKAVKKIPFKLGRATKITTYSGQLLRINPDGTLDRSSFNDDKLYEGYQHNWSPWQGISSFWNPSSTPDTEEDYISNLKCVAGCYGYSGDDIDSLLAEGYTTDEIEDALYEEEYF